MAEQKNERTFSDSVHWAPCFLLPVRWRFMGRYYIASTLLHDCQMKADPSVFSSQTESECHIKGFCKIGTKCLPSWVLKGEKEIDFFSHNFQDQVHIPCHGTQALAHQACLCLASSSATLCAHQSHEQTQLSHTLSYAHSVPFPWMPFFPRVPVAACTSKLNSHVASLIRYLFFLLLEQHSQQKKASGLNSSSATC